MIKLLTKMKGTLGLLLVVTVLAGLIVTPSITSAAPLQGSFHNGNRAWSFGVIADTQWTVADDGYNPNTIAANVVKQIDQQFIEAGVKLVVAVGDTVDKGEPANIKTRALYAQDLYNTGIAFYPLRGNHEANEDTTLTSGKVLQYAFPQIGTGVNNNTPSDITTALIPAVDLANNPPAEKKGKTFTVGSNFSAPTAVNTANNSLSYAFSYNNATFVLLDQFDLNGNYTNSTIAQQQGWITETLSSRPANTHAFVFSHKNILGGNHKDSLFGINLTPADSTAGKDPGDGSGMDTTKLTADELAALKAKQDAENKFLASLQANKVPLVITGHDHHHLLSQITSPDGQSKVHQLITQSASSKFYTPVAPFSANDTSIEQDLGRVGYYIFTVDGLQVTVDYYADVTGGNDYGLNGSTFNFVKRSSFSYSLNGTDKIIAEGSSTAITDNTTVAATMEDGYKGTTMSILAGTNDSTATTNYGQKTSNDITTGWARSEKNLTSDILTLGGMAKSFGSEKTSEYVLSMSYKGNEANQGLIQQGRFILLTRNEQGEWTNAAKADFATTTRFVLGPWNSSYKLGTYGVDTATNTAWAVLNYNGDFAIGDASK